MDLSNSVIMPREDFIELSECAFNQTPATLSERVGTTIQTFLFCGILTASVTAGAWGWAKAVDHLEERRYARWEKQNRPGRTK